MPNLRNDDVINGTNLYHERNLLWFKTPLLLETNDCSQLYKVYS